MTQNPIFVLLGAEVIRDMMTHLRMNIRYRIVHSPILTMIVSAMASAAQGEYSVFTLRVGRERITVRVYIRTLMYEQGRSNAFIFESFCTIGDGKDESTKAPARFRINGFFDAARPKDDRGYVKFHEVP